MAKKMRFPQQIWGTIGDTMRKREPKSLYKEAEPIMIDVRLVVLMSFILFIVLALIGSAFRHYPSIASII